MLYQNTKTGQIVEWIGTHDPEWAMCKNQAGEVKIVQLAHLVEYTTAEGRTDRKPEVLVKEEKKKDEIPAEVFPVERRLNMNLATAELIAKIVKGVGYATAKKIVEYRNSLPNERFVDLEQLRKVPRVNWDAVIEDDLIFIQ